ncbi:MAG: hypothetical protein F4066_06250 [Chloroflexi bacterium]|nr:hypothetical protein [Chloroflexota bacterium]MYB23112.1 hypothetical protein [Chloroflexota bacterium]MYD16440.1 hypothetical protein [Chloroflexota bacterium]MYF81528.1 hypothetical protein [Chloroflexota bacterium]MYI04447.1 hypothetical protein [Chloroflexota bacterium]
MGFWRGLRWGLFLGVVAALVGRILSGPDNEANWDQAKIAGDLAAAQTEAEQREKFNRSRSGESGD